MKIFIKPFATALFSLALLAACSTPAPVPVQAPVANKSVSVAVRNNIDVSKGKTHTPATFSLKIRTAGGEFGLKANTSGSSNMLAADISSFDVYLIDSAGAPSGTITPTYGPFSVSANLVAGQQTIVFSNLVTSTNAYYVAILAKDSGGNNITNLSSGNDIGGENVYVSTAGGDGGGAISVGAAPSYTVSAATPLSVGLTLLDAMGASLDSEVTVTDGSVLPIAPISVN